MGASRRAWPRGCRFCGEIGGAPEAACTEFEYNENARL